MLAFAAALLLGLLSGAMLLIGVAVVPFWESLPPAEFRTWFARHSFRLARVMIPLGAGAALTAIAAALRERSASLVVAACGATAVVAITALVNEPANRRFASAGGLGDPDTVALLARWRRWHWVRIVAGMVAFFAALRAR